MQTNSPSHSERKRHRSKVSSCRKAHTELDLARYKRKDVLPAHLEKKIYALAESSGKVNRMTVELDTHQKCVTNLAATVVRQNEQILDLKRHVKELLSLLDSQDRSPCTDSAMDTTECQCSLSSRSLSSRNSDSPSSDHDSLDSAIEEAKNLNAMLDEMRALIKLKRETARSVKSPSKRHRRTRSLSGGFCSLEV